ncbi:hypothetical protein NAL32_00430 [Chryseobacterium sp. Ch-15]|uniref:DUF3592 domain-containing protein n=1 Tax=Chryseobacterium muglaense TaxID=2893752 RepID=A0A9Q3UVJ4_9FLAO|nr:hypothetical protein [Chryseobacterium muglaense]MBD3903514.1 hypothetical protein [Chryseobacterium muglaense]MCC9034586.1 hypothetical protein [Chryseobacterium muglaense]MCM2552849.1 hypothetical protein [Chryseobacterium muglaense]
MKNKALLYGILLILVGFSVIFFFGYKDNSFLEIISYLAFFCGWLIITFSLLGKYYSFGKPKFIANKILWIKKTMKNTLIICFAIIGMFSSMFITGNLTDQRIQNILGNEPTEKTIAEVINLESRYTRGGWKIWAIFQYKTRNGIYKKGIYNYSGNFKKGDKYSIIYSVKYPEIAEIKNKVENN